MSIIPAAMATAAETVGVAVFLISACHGWALELAAISLAVFFLRYAVVPYANHMAASLSSLQAMVASDAVIASYRRPSPGLDGATIARLPCFVAVRRTDEGDVAATTECPVCLGAVEEGETVRALPFCRHTFHARCVDAWLRLRATCPVCRATCRSQP
uniref:Uncharacterized protein n=1 Tax=Avena sativa TaxID=4498 RepID=A0ACD5VG64_AVESA